MDMTNVKLLKKSKLDIEKIEKHLKELKKRYGELEADVFSEMVQEQIDSVKFDGTLFITQILERPSLKKEQQQPFFRYLHRHKFGGLIVTRRAVAPQTLGKWFREYTEGSPRRKRVLERYLNVFSESKVLMRGVHEGEGSE